ncbi:MAG: hypothetical protein ACLQFR_06555 [Streptosporangiaceae bacterium]
MAGSLRKRLSRAGVPVMLLAAGLGMAIGPAQVALAGRPPGGIISTVAGGTGGPGPGVSLAVNACGVKFVRGALYIGGDGSVRRVNPRTGWLTTAVSGWQGNPVAALTGPCGVTVDAAGNVLEANGWQVRAKASRNGRFYGQKMIAGRIYAIAGAGVPRILGESNGNGGPALDAVFSGASDVELDHAGNLIVADSGSPPERGGPPLGALVWVVAVHSGRFYGQKMTAGDIYTVAGTSAPGTGKSSLATKAWLGMTVGSVRTDRFGNLVVADGGTEGFPLPIPKLAPAVRIVAVRTGRFYGKRMTAGHIYRIAGNGQAGDSGNGRLATRAELACAAAAAIDRAGNVVIADCGQVRVLAARPGRFYGQPMVAGHIYAVAGTGTSGYSGDGGPAGKARVDAINATVDNRGNVVLADRSARVRVVAARTGRMYGREMRASHMYTIAGDGNILNSGDGQPATRAEFQPYGVAADSAGDTAIADDSAARVWFIPARPGAFFGRKMTAGDIYRIATGVDAAAVTFDRAGNVVQGGGNDVNVIAVRSGTFYGQPMTAGHLYNIAHGFEAFGVAADSVGNILAADQVDDLIKVMAVKSGTFYGQQMTAGDVYTIAGNGQPGNTGDGGPAIDAGVDYPGGVAVDHTGNVLIAAGNIRVVAVKTGMFYGQHMTAGDIYSIAKFPAVASFSLAVDGAGNVVAAEQTQHHVQVFAVVSGTFYGQRMTAGHLYNIAGIGSPGYGQAGFSGDGGPGTHAALDGPDGVAVSPAGNVLIADFFNLRIRSVSG